MARTFKSDEVDLIRAIVRDEIEIGMRKIVREEIAAQELKKTIGKDSSPNHGACANFDTFENLGPRSAEEIRKKPKFKLNLDGCEYKK